MNRRTFLVTALVVAVPSFGLVKAHVAKADLPQLMQTLQALADQPVQTTGVWSAAEIFQHCAGSIEGSMKGYPVHKSPAFKATIGKLAFTGFQAAGAMRHGLAEAIPGMPAFDPQLPFEQALAQLLTSLQRFIEYSGPLQPHFAYGELTHDEYALAHAMHISNHLSEFVIG